MPDGPAQHVLPQSAPLRHWPPINCAPAAFPTFLTPEGSKAGPPAAFVPATALPLATAAAATLEAGEEEAGVLAEVEFELENPQPVLPFWVCAPTPEQIPVGEAQHAELQSALERHWPPMNWVPALLPTFLAPEGSKGGTAETRSATVWEDCWLVVVSVMVIFKGEGGTYG